MTSEDRSNIRRVARHICAWDHPSKPFAMEHLILALVRSIGSPVSYDKLEIDASIDGSRRLSTNTISSYVSHLVSNKIICEVRRLDLEQGALLNGQRYFYFRDYRQLVAFGAESLATSAGLAENGVFCTLNSLGAAIFSGRLSTRKTLSGTARVRCADRITFVAKRIERCSYVQVISSYADGVELDRAVTSLLSIKDNNYKFIVSAQGDAQQVLGNGIVLLDLHAFLQKCGTDALPGIGQPQRGPTFHGSTGVN